MWNTQKTVATGTFLSSGLSAFRALPDSTLRRDLLILDEASCPTRWKETHRASQTATTSVQRWGERKVRDKCNRKVTYLALAFSSSV